MNAHYLRSCVAIALFLVVGCTQDPNIKKQQYLERGTKFLTDGQYNEAVIELKNALQIDPKFAPALHAIGRAYRAKSWHGDAVKELQRAVELAPDNLGARVDLAQVYLDLEAWGLALEQGEALRARAPGRVEELYVRGAALQGKGDSAQAVELLAAARSLGAPAPELQKVYGDSLTMLGRPVEAEQAYRDAIAKRSTYSEALVGLARLLWRQDKRDAALATLNQAKTVAPESPRVALAFSDLHAQEGKLAEAIKDLEGLQRQAWSPRIMITLGYLYVRTGDYEKALLTLRPLAQMPSPAPAVRYLSAYAALGLNRTDDAIRDFQAVVLQAPDNIFARFGLGSAYLAAGRARDALREFGILAKPLGGVGDYHLHVARAHLQLGDYDSAAKAAETARGLMPANPQPWGALGTIYAARGDLKRAQDMYAKAIEVDPGFMPGRVALGNVYSIEKRPEEALQEYDIALRADPKYAPALQAKIATLVGQNRTDEAVGVVQSALKHDPANPELYTALAALHEKKGDRKRAEEDLRRAIAANEKYAPARLALARLLLASQREGDAIAQLQRVLTDRPTDVTATLMLANIHASQARYDQAIGILEPAAKAAPSARELTLALADLYLKRGRFDDAVALLVPVVSTAPSFVPLRLLLGLAYLGKYKTAEAIREFEQVNQINPSIAAGHYYRARALLARSNVDGARKAYQQALELAPDSKEIRIELAALSGQKVDEALLASHIDDLKASLSRDPTNIAIRNALARAYLLRNQLKEADAEYQRILEVAPTFAPANLAMGALRLQGGKPDEAATYLKTVIRIEPRNLQANMLLGDYYVAKGNLEAATQHLETANRVGPPNIDLKVRLAGLYAQSGRAEQGLTLAKEVITADPKRATAYLVVGQIRLQRGELQPATDALNTAITLQPNLAPAHFMLGSVYQRKGDTAKAVAAYRKVLSLNPKDPAALNNLAWTYADRRENLEEALALALSAQEVSPDSATILDTVGFVYYQRKEYARAEPVLKKAAELGSSLAPAHYHLGMTYYRLGKKDDAVASLKRALKLDENLSDAAEARRVLRELGAS